MRTGWSEDLTRAYLSRPIEPVRLSGWYRLGLLGVAATLVLLQLIYVALVVLTGWATYQYLMLIPGIVSVVHVNFLTIVLVAAPLVAGVVVTFFLLKPLLAGGGKAPEMMVLDRSEEPELFGYVERLCAMVGAPAPKEIAVDLQVNASARLRRGWWSLVTGDLALTVGLPLVAGLNLPQFSGVLAHEFGHFSQKAGMRLHFLIGSSRMWFARVAYERDEWDERLERWGRESGWRMKAVLGVAAGAVWLSRAVLRGLLWVAGVVSAWFSRQMEYDADRHEAGLVGAEVFQQTTVRLAELGYANHRAWQVVERSWLLRKVPDRFPVLVARLDQGSEAAVRSQLVNEMFAEKTGRWATHPSASDRVANVEGLAGMLAAEEEPPAASVLFRDFEKVCTAATAHHYAQSLGERLEPEHLVEGAQFAEEKAIELKNLDALASMFPNAHMPSRWFQLLEHEGDVVLKVGLEDVTKDYWFWIGQSLSRRAGLEFLRAGGRINPTGFELSSGELADAEREAAESRQKLEAEMDRLGEEYRAVGRLLAEDAGLRAAYGALAREQKLLLELRHLLVAYRVMVENAEILGLATGLNAREGLERKMRSICEQVEGRLAETAVGAELRAVEGVELVGRVASLLDRVDVVAQRVLGELCRSSE